MCGGWLNIMPPNGPRDAYVTLAANKGWLTGYGLGATFHRFGSARLSQHHGDEHRQAVPDARLGALKHFAAGRSYASALAARCRPDTRYSVVAAIQPASRGPSFITHMLDRALRPAAAAIRNDGNLTGAAMPVDKRNVVVTGGAGGIGTAISATLKRLGYKVVATGHDHAEIAARQGDPALEGVRLAALDVGDPAAVDRFAGEFDRIEVLVNCAGTTVRGPDAFEEAAFAAVIDINLLGSMRTCRAFRPALSRGGAIVNIASMMSFRGSATAPGYAASKGGITALTKSLAMAWAEQNIRVNAVAPGWIITPLTERAIDPELRARVIERTPMRRWGQPQDIADAVAFLCSAQASFITGIVLPVDGGYLAT